MLPRELTQEIVEEATRQIERMARLKPGQLRLEVTDVGNGRSMARVTGEPELTEEEYKRVGDVLRTISFVAGARPVRTWEEECAASHWVGKA
jgi:hypothetical protein